MSDWLAELQNLSYSLRTLRHNKGFTAVALLTSPSRSAPTPRSSASPTPSSCNRRHTGSRTRLIAVYENNIPSQSPRISSPPPTSDYRAYQHSLTNLAAFAA